MTTDEAIAKLRPLLPAEHVRLEAAAIANVACSHCPSRIGFPCQINTKNGIGSFLPGYAHIARKIDWVIMADTLDESMLPDMPDEPWHTTNPHRVIGSPSIEDLSDILGEEDLSDIL